MLYIQDSSFSDTYSTHEALISTCASSVSGYGAYAFASKSGVEILMQDKEFDLLLKRGPYSMIVGIDNITDERCLKLLKSIMDQYPNLSVKAYLHDDSSSLFHPKISFFKNDQGKGSLIVGSGNLTLGGLRKNKEAFGIIALSESEYTDVESYWLKWMHESNCFLKDIDDLAVIERARKNKFVRNYQKIVSSGSLVDEAAIQEVDVADIQIDINEHEEQSESIFEGWTFTKDSRVLLAEIPQSGNRWKQANFDQGTFTNFFGATLGDNSQRILLRSINQNNLLNPIEIRPSVTVLSQNYRFELEDAVGSYPLAGRPLGIFIQITTRMFLYKIFMPSDILHSKINEWMQENWSGRSDRMIRITTQVSEVSDIIDTSIFKQYET